jgi:DNA-binding NtrC family response regulator
MKKVVVIDDDLDYLEVFVEVLVEQFPLFQIDSFSSSLEALGVLADYDVVLTDYRMPEVTGRDIIKEAVSLKIPIIVLISGEFPGGIKNEFKDKVAFFDKPIHFDSLFEFIINSLEKIK